MILVVAISLGSFFLVATLLPLIRSEDWWIRAFDFPRLQIFFIGLVAMSLFMIQFTFGPFETVYLGCITAGLIYQWVRISPYTFLHKYQTVHASIKKEENLVGVLISNVYMKNRQADKLIQVVRNANPDLFLAAEVNGWWMEQLKVLEEHFPYSIKVPQENTYGILLFSKLRLINAEVIHWVEQDVPSVKTMVELRSGQRILFYGIHPRPPAPTKVATSVQRDAELVLVARDSLHAPYPVIVAGDLNDVAWSHTTHLFQKISGLLDPRVGRGMYGTFNAKYPFVRWPLDHLFHSNDFSLVHIECLSPIGSDHFPIFIKLNHEPEKKSEHKEIESSEEDAKEAIEKVRKAEKG